MPIYMEIYSRVYICEFEQLMYVKNKYPLANSGWLCSARSFLRHRHRSFNTPMHRSIALRTDTCASVYHGVLGSSFNFGVIKYDNVGYPESPIHTKKYFSFVYFILQYVEDRKKYIYTYMYLLLIP